MSFTVAQIDAQTKRFEQAYRKGEITQGQYQHAMRVQSANRAAALKREQASQPKQQPSAPAQTPTAAELPRSDYWTATPSPAKPSVMPASGADLTRAGGTQITPPAGYTVTKVESVMVPAKEELEPSSYWTATPTPEKTAVMGPTVAKAPMVEAVSYEVTKKPEPVKQSDLGIAAQADIAMQTGLKLFHGLIEKSDAHPIVKGLGKAEVDYGMAPLLGYGVGGAATLESTVYGTAGLVGSAVKSVKEQKLVYAPGFEGFNEQWKTPKLAPTSIGSVVGLVTGNPQEAQEINRMPSTYGWGYGMGSAIAEVGIAALESKGIGKIATVVNPRINRAAESALARSTRLFESAANRIEPGLGKATELVISRDAAAIGTKLDLVEAKAGAALTGKLISPVKYGVKYGVVEPVKAKVSLVGERVASSQVVSKAGGVARRVISDLKVYSKVVTGKYADDLVSQAVKDVRLASEPFRDVPKNLVKGIKETNVYQGASFVKSVQVPNTEMAKLLRAVPKSSLDDLTLKSALRAEQKLVSPAVTKGVSKVAVTKPYISKELGQIGSLTTVKTKTSTPITKMVSDIEKSASSARASIGKAVGTRQTVITQVKPLSVKSTKNISTFEALQMSKQVAKQGKRLTQLVPYAPKEVSAIKPAAEIKQATTQIQKVTQKQTKDVRLVSGVPSLAPAYPGTQRQRVSEEYELVSVSYPKATGKRDSFVPTLVPSIVPTPRIEPAIKVLPDRIVPPRVRPVIVPRVLPKSDVKITPSYRPALVQPQAIKQIPKTSPRIAPPPMGKPRVPQMPSFRLGGSGGGRGGGDALTGRWFKYKNPVKTPKQVLKDFESFGGKSRVSISTPKFKQPRINYNLSKQRRKRKR